MKSYDCAISLITGFFNEPEVISLAKETKVRKAAINKVSEHVNFLGSEDAFMESLNSETLPEEIAKAYNFLSELHVIYSQILQDLKKDYIKKDFCPSVQLKKMIQKETSEVFETKFFNKSFEEIDNATIRNQLKSQLKKQQFYRDLVEHNYVECKEKHGFCPIEILAPYIDSVGKEKFEELKYHNELPHDVYQAYQMYTSLTEADMFE